MAKVVAYKIKDESWVKNKADRLGKVSNVVEVEEYLDRYLHRPTVTIIGIDKYGKTRWVRVDKGCPCHSKNSNYDKLHLKPLHAKHLKSLGPDDLVDTCYLLQASARFHKKDEVGNVAVIIPWDIYNRLLNLVSEARTASERLYRMCGFDGK